MLVKYRSPWLAVALAIAFPSLAAWVYFVVLSGAEAVSLVYSAAKVVQFSFPLVWMFAVERRRPRLALPEARSLAWGAALGLAIVAAALALYFGVLRDSPWLAAAPQGIAAKLVDIGLTTPLRFWAFAAFVCLAHSLMEEYYWRWFVFGQLRRVASVRLAIAVSSLGFMAHHVIILDQFLDSPVAIAFFSMCVAIGGALWAWMYDRVGSLYGPWLSHLLVDAVLMVIGYDLVRNTAGW